MLPRPVCRDCPPSSLKRTGGAPNRTGMPGPGLRHQSQGNRMNVMRRGVPAGTGRSSPASSAFPRRDPALDLRSTFIPACLMTARLAGPLSLRTLLSSSRKLTSSTRWRPFPITRCERAAWARKSASSARDETKCPVRGPVFPSSARTRTTRPMPAGSLHPGWRSPATRCRRTGCMSGSRPRPCPRQRSDGIEHSRVPAPRTTASRHRGGFPGWP